MSALGQKQTCAAQQVDVRFTPESRHQRSDLMNFQSSIVSFERAPCR